MVKSRKEETLIDDLKETFDNLRVYKMMLNPAKCVFGVPAGKLLGFLVSNRETQEFACRNIKDIFGWVKYYFIDLEIIKGFF